VKLEGLFEHKIYENAETGFSGFYMSANSGKIFCKGKIQDLISKTPVQLTGSYKKDKNGKEYFAFNEYTILYNDSANAIKFMAAFDILDTDTCINICTDYPDIVSLINASSSEKELLYNLDEKYHKDIHKIYKKAKFILHEKELYDIISSAGGNYYDTKKIYNLYSIKSIERLKKDPFTVCKSTYVDYKIALTLANQFNIPKYRRCRARGMLWNLLDIAESSGSTYITLKDIALRVSDYRMYMFIISCAELDRNVLIIDDKIFFKKTYYKEKSIARNIHRLKSQNEKTEINIDILNNVIGDFKPSESQYSAILGAISSKGIKVITGGPGTGKTTITKLILDYYLRTGYVLDDIALASPTGNAAQNMSIKTGLPAYTLNKLLKIIPYENNDELLATQKLDQKIYIIDEASMLSLDLAEVLFNSIPNNSTLILIGDVDQLPAIGPGKILEDLISSDLEVYKLTHTYRQTEDSNIIDISYKINNGDTNLPTNCADFEVYTMPDTNSIVELSSSFYTDNSEILTPINKHISGCNYINKIIQERLLETKKICPDSIPFGSTEFHLGDMIIATENNYTVGYINGDMGKIVSIDYDGIYVKFLNKDLFINKKDLKDIKLAYSITVHKSQGQEYDSVIIILTPESINMINKQLLYTAVTRAKKQVIIMETPGLLKKAILTMPKKRYTYLSKLLEKNA